MDQKQREDYYVSVAKAVAEGSTCWLFKEGAILVNPTGDIIATGYNGAVDACVDCNKNKVCTYAATTGDISNGSQEQCMGLHAEVNALLSAGKDKAHNATLYIYSEDRRTGKTVPVYIDGIVGHIIQACKIKNIVTHEVGDIVDY